MKTLPKTTAEIRIYEFPFGMQPEFDAGATIDSIDVIAVTPSGQLTIGSPTIVGSSVFLTISGGVNGTRYFIDLKANLNTGAKLEASGVLSIVDPVIPSV